MKRKLTFSATKVLKCFSIVLSVSLLIASLSGCSVGPFNLSFLDNFRKGGVDEQDLYWLDTSLLSASLLNSDDGTFSAVYEEGGVFALGNNEDAVKYDLSDSSVETIEPISGGDRPFVFSSGSFTFDGDISALFDAYKDHHSAVFGSYEQAINSDINDDGVNDLIFVAKGVLSAEAAVETFGSEFEEQYVCLYVSLYEGSVYYQASPICAPSGTVTSCAFKSGFLTLKDSSGTTVSTDIYEKFGKKTKLETQLKDYVKSIQNAGADDVRVRLCALTESSETDAVICYQLGDRYVVEFCSVVDDRFSIVLRHDTARSPGAFLLTNEGDHYSVFTYNQEIADDNLVDYSFNTVSFDRKFRISEIDGQAISVNTTENVSLKVNQFFKAVSDKISNATVCYDPYKLTGYMLMLNFNELGIGEDEEPYVIITNCSTSKSGYVMIDDADTWLNLREGPSKDFDRVLMNPKDKKSFVKQALFSPITVLEPVNTYDSKNPIWLKIEINYMNKTLVGYSSQRYIEIPGIKTLNSGQSFTVEAVSNTGEISWYSSDYSVVDVNEYTGEIVANAPGIALVSAITDSGVSDSCLIMVK